MHIAAISTHPATQPPVVRSRSPFLALYLKDLRFSAIVAVPGLVLLAAIVAFYAFLPLLGSDAMHAAGLSIWNRVNIVDRIGMVAPVVWPISTLVVVLSTVVIAGGDCCGRARHLLPVLPVASGLAYASKLCAVATVLAIYLAIALAIQTTSKQLVGDEIGLYAAALALGLIWAFAAPLFARNFSGACVATAIAPILLFVVCGMVAGFVAPLLLSGALSSFDAARWYSKQPYLTTELQPLDIKPVQASMWISAAIVVAGVGLWASWTARPIVLCGRTPPRLGFRRIARFAAVALLAVVVSTLTTAVAAWRKDSLIAPAVRMARFYREFSALTTVQLVESYVQTRGSIPSAVLPRRQGELPIWWDVLNAIYPWRDGNSYGQQLAGVLTVACWERLVSDPETMVKAARSIVEDRAGRKIGLRLAAAELIGNQTELAVALRGLGEETTDLERAMLVVVVSNNRRLLGPDVQGPSVPTESQPKRSHLYGFEGWELAPFGMLDFSLEQPYPAVLQRACAAVTLAYAAKRARGGPIVLANPRSEGARVEIDAETIRRARIALERPFPELAKQAGAIERRPVDVAQYTDNETLFLRTSELFDRDRTDPSYLLPVD